MSASSPRRVDAGKSELEKTFPPWRILVTDQRRWWALRGPMPPERINEVDAVEADTAEQLRDKLEELAVVVSPPGDSYRGEFVRGIGAVATNGSRPA